MVGNRVKLLIHNMVSMLSETNFTCKNFIFQISGCTVSKLLDSACVCLYLSDGRLISHTEDFFLCNLITFVAILWKFCSAILTKECAG